MRVVKYARGVRRIFFARFLGDDPGQRSGVRRGGWGWRCGLRRCGRERVQRVNSRIAFIGGGCWSVPVMNRFEVMFKFHYDCECGPVGPARSNPSWHLTQPSHPGCNRTPSWAGSRSLGRGSERQRRSVLQPRVGAPAPTLGVRAKYLPTPTGLRHWVSPDQAATPSGLMVIMMRVPRVARASQPWANGWNTVGVLLRSTSRLDGPQRASWPPSLSLGR